jgi:outer membrane immunogenic protein
MKKLAIAAATVAFAGSAQAADLYVKAPVAAWYDWSGIYVGANAGGGWGNETWAFPTNNFFVNNAPASFTTHPTGALAGGQVGINKQYGNWVWGVELTGDWSSLSQSLTGPISPSFPNDVWTTKLRDLETLTVRTGWAFNNVLLYTKAGGATGAVGVHALSGVPVPGVTFDTSERLWGITSGVGLEYGLTANWILGVEYDYTRLWAGTFNGLPSPNGFNNSPITFGASSAFTVQSVVGRVSYKF